MISRLNLKASVDKIKTNVASRAVGVVNLEYFGNEADGTDVMRETIDRMADYDQIDQFKQVKDIKINVVTELNVCEV